MEEEESLDCPVCFEQYDDNARVPKMMSCLHTVCVSCILDLLGLEGQHRGASEPEIPRGRKVTCPLCREEILTEKMQTNRYIVAHLRHLIRLGGLPNGETQHKTAAGTGTDRVKAMGVPVFPVKQQHPPRLAPAPPLPRRPTPPPPPRNPPPSPPLRTPPPQLEPRGVRRTSAPLPPSTAGEGERTPPAAGIVAKPPRPFPFGGPQKSPPPPAHPSRPLLSPPYPSPPSSCPPPPAYPSPTSSYPSPTFSNDDEVAWIEEFQKRKQQVEQDLALALQLTEVSLQDTPDSSSPATKSSVIVPVGR
nr:wiskott-Aldrich syndrome protein family member 2-like [Penaeus vannamei]